MAKVTFKNNTPSWELDEEEKKVWEKVSSSKYSKEDNEVLINTTNAQAKSIADRLKSTEFKDTKTRVQLQKDLYSFQNNLKRLRSRGYDTATAEENFKTLQSYADLQSVTFSQFKTEKDYEDWRIGWLQDDAEVNQETASARQERYKTNEKRMGEIEESLPWYASSFVPNWAENWFLSKDEEALRDEYESIKAENNQYKRKQSALDEYYTPETPEFLESASHRDYTNATREDLSKYMGNQSYITQLLSSGSHEWDADGNIINSYSGDVVYAADDLSRAMMAEAEDPFAGGFFDTDTSDNPINQFYNSAVQDKLGMFLSASEDEIVEAYSELASLPTSANHMWANILREGDQNGWKYLTEHELNIYYNLYKTQGQAAAYKFLEDMAVELTRRDTVARQEKIDEAEGLEQLWLNVQSIPQNVFGGAIAFTEDAAHLIRGEDINPYSKAHSWQNDAQYVRQVTAEDINNATGNASLPWLGTSWGDVYQSVMSAGDSAVGLAIGSNAYGVLMGMGAASSEMKDMWEKGASADQMIAGGLLAGAAEMVFEKISIDSLVKMKSPRTIKGVIANLLKQGGIEASEEAATEIANTITNSIVMGSQSDWVDAETFVKSVLNAGLSGFISGGLMGGGGSVAQYTGNQAQNFAQGRSIMDAEGGVDALRELAMDIVQNSSQKTQDSVAKLSNKVSGEKVKAGNVGRLYRATGEAISEQNQADIVKSLERKGYSTKEANSIADALVAKYSGSKLTDKQSALLASLEGNDKISQTIKDVVLNEKSTAGQRSDRIDTFDYGIANGIGISTDASKTRKNIQNLSLKKEIAKSEYEVSADGKTINTKTGDVVNIKKIDSISESGEANLTIDGDMVVKASDLSFGSEAEALLIESIGKIKLGKKSISTTSANNLYMKAMKVLDENPNMTASEAMSLIKGLEESFVYGAYNFNKTRLTDNSAVAFAHELTEDQRQFAYELGTKERASEVESAQKFIDELKVKGNASKTGKGKVRFAEGVVAKGKNQKRAVSLAKHLARAIGIDIVFYDARTTTNEDGKDANGYFDEATDTIYLDLQNSHDDAKTIVFTLSHELVHFIKKWSPAKFDTFAKFLVEQYTDHGVDVSQLVANKMAQLETEDTELAYEEVVCDACETMLLDSNAVYKLMELRKTDLELFDKIKLHIYELLNKIRAMYKELGLTPTSDEAKALLGMEDVLEQMYALFEEAAVDAAQSYQAVGTLETESVSVSEDGTIKMQMKQYQQTGRATLLNYLKEQYGAADANDLISTIDNIYNAMAEIKKDTALSVFGNWQDTEVELDENGHPIFTTSINNGDYKLNQDFSRVCKKRRQLDFVLNMLAEDPAFEASNLTKDDIVKINQAIKKHGFEIACALCFVDSKRFRQTEWADSFANTWNDILYSVVGDKSKLTPFNFATKNPNLTDDGIEIDTSKPVMYRKWSDGKEDVKNRKNHDSFDSMLEKKANGKFVEGNANVRAIVKILKENPHLRHTFRGADIIGSQGFDTIQRLAPNIRGILDGWGGTSVPKPSSNDAIYDNSVLNIAGYNAKSAFAIGGVRMNSFSDFMAHMFFDYVQAFADLSAKGLPMHSYTKELDFARLFGLAKGKINMSAIAAVRQNATDLNKIKKKADKDKATEWEKSIAGLDISKVAEKLGKAEADITYDDIIQNLDACEYVWADESIDVRSATLLQSGIMYDNLTEGKAAYCYELIKEGKFEEAFKVAGEKNVNRNYAKHLGIITVGVSKAHILKLLRDPTIRMVIPYHKSGLNAQVAAALKIAFYEDFTDVQNTMLLKKDGSTVGLSKDGAKIGDKNIGDFNFYKYFGKTIDGVFYDGKATATKYLEWCEKGEYNESVGEYGYYLTDGSFITKAELNEKGLSILPKFNEFAEEENYYKLVEDFDCYDTITGEHSPQEAVDLFHDGLPADYKAVLIKALKAEQKVSDDFRDHLDNHGLRDEVMEIVKSRGYTPSVKKQAKKKNSENFVEDKYFKSQMRKWDSLSHGSYIKVGEIKEDHPLVKVGMPQGIIKYDVDKLNKNMEKHAYLNTDLLNEIPNIIANPVAISEYTEENTVSVFGNVFVGNSPMMVGVTISKDRSGANIGKVRTFNARRDVGALITDDTILYLNEDKKRTRTWFQACGIQVPLGETKFGFIRSISQKEKTVKKQLKKDSDYMDAVNRGDMETAQRMVEEVARAKGYDSPLLYHGTKSFGFTVIETVGVEEDALWSPFFVTNKIDTAQTYSGATTIRKVAEKYDVYSIDDLLTDFVYEVNRAAGFHNFMPYDTSDFDEVIERVERGEVDFQTEEMFNDVVSEIEQSLYENSAYYDENLDEDTFFDSDEMLDFSKAVRELWEGLKSVAEKGDAESGNYQFYANTSNLLVVDGNNNFWNRIPLGNIEEEFNKWKEEEGIKRVKTRDIAEFALDKGYSGVKIKNIWDDGGRSEKSVSEPSDVYIFFNPQEQVKSADPVTYDDQGNVIPLSERFNKENDDIRYQKKRPTNRSILANSLESAAQNDIERNKLAQYKEKIALIESEEKRLSEIQKQLFTKGGVEPENRKALQFEAKQIANRINTYDRQLLNLEATTALKNVLSREKALAMKRQKQKDAEAMAKYKEKVAKTQRELLERHKESRKKAIESRERTAMRHKIQKVVSDLNNLLLKPTKERHVPEEMRIAVAEALSILNLDTVGADERVAKYDALIAKAKDPDVIASLTETRDRIQEQGNKLADKLLKLKQAYEAVRDSADDSLRSMYDDVIYNKIEKVQKTVGNTPIRNMTLEQLESVYELYKMVLTTVRDANKAFAENIKQSRLELGSNTFAEIKKNNKARDTIKLPHLERFMWQNLKPMQAMKTIGSDVLQKLWNNILYGQETFAVDYDEAVKFAKEMKEKYGYKKWNKNKLFSFGSKSGKMMKLNLEQMMSIYAYSKRKQADEHIEFGGIVLNEGVRKVKNKFGKTVEVQVNDSTAYRLDKMQVANIVETLDKEFPGAIDFVDEMQKYLSETMGEKGNEVSMKMYGIKLFKEGHYFPLKSSKDFMEAANAKLKGDVKIKNKGMTKAVVEHARNPIVLEGFLDVWGNHVSEMAMYHGLVLPLEDFSKTLNYSFKADDNLNTDAESVRTALHDAFGESADNYLNELLKAINGGVLHDASTQIADKMISRFKKAKVMASLSVIVQQPTAVIRAMSIIDPKYFVAQNFNHKQTWEELKKYCPTAIIKETGSFDTNMGKTIVDMVKDEGSFVDKVGDTLGKAPAFMDEVGWNTIWRALKKKVATEQKLSGEELLQECGKQMTLIINETQVYDSVMARTELMRSKNALTKMATAFGAEPATVSNMIYGAALDFKRGNIKVASKTVAATIASVVVNGLVSSLVYALRDDDEDETLLEKYLSSATTEVLDGLNPLTYIPFVKDAYSLFQGYKVERTDMALIKEVVDAINGFYNVLDPEAYEGMSQKEIASHIYENAVPMLTSICDMFGLPVGNILRDAEAIIINDNVPMSQTSSSGIGYALKEGVLGALPEIVGKVVGSDTTGDKLYDAIVSGDTAYEDRLKSGYKDDKAYESAVRKALRENDPRIKEAAESSYNGDVSEYSDIIDEIIAEGNFEVDDIKAAIKAEYNKLKPDESTDEDNEKSVSRYDSHHYFDALINGDVSTAYEVKEDIVNTDIANGKSEDDAEDDFFNAFRNDVRDGYADGTLSRSKALDMLVEYGGMDNNESYWQMKKYDYYVANGTNDGYSKYDDFYVSVKTGKNIKAVIREYIDHGVSAETLARQITTYYKPLYREMTNSERASIKGYLLNAYVLLGKNRYAKSKDIDDWLKD